MHAGAVCGGCRARGADGRPTPGTVRTGAGGRGERGGTSAVGGHLRVLWSERRCSLGTAVAPCSHAKPSSSPQTTTASGRPRAGFSCRAGGLAGRSKSSRHQAGSSPTFLPRARPKAGQQGRHGHSAGRHALTRAGRHGTSAQQPACHATLDGDRKSEAAGAACCLRDRPLVRYRSSFFHLNLERFPACLAVAY